MERTKTMWKNTTAKLFLPSDWHNVLFCFRTRAIKPEEPTMLFVTKCPCDECVPLIRGAGVTHIYTTDQDRDKDKVDISYLRFGSLKNISKFIVSTLSDGGRRATILFSFISLLCCCMLMFLDFVLRPSLRWPLQVQSNFSEANFYTLTRRKMHVNLFCYIMTFSLTRQLFLISCCWCSWWKQIQSLDFTTSGKQLTFFCLHSGRGAPRLVRRPPLTTPVSSPLYIYWCLLNAPSPSRIVVSVLFPYLFQMVVSGSTAGRLMRRATATRSCAPADRTTRPTLAEHQPPIGWMDR